MTTKTFPKHYKNFVLKKTTPIQEIGATLFELEHEPTKAKVLHIAIDDDENVFSLSFRTYPNSSDGVAHILEHTVLCGSQKFPVKDPFFAMTRRSLNTFMNAMTGTDFTCYPAASQNEKDFYQILDVYLDAVFYPLLDERSFLQEGHRLEFESKLNAKSPLTIQGIVYNEMKGSMNSPESRLYRELYKALFKGLPYQYNSGGDPEEIPNLTYRGLKDFHEKYYHPSNCIFYFYGNFPLEKHLDFIDAQVLSKTEIKPIIPLLPKQERLKHPIRVESSYPVQENKESQDFVALAFLTTNVKNQLDCLALSLLGELLMESDASFLKHSIQNSGLAVQADSFIETDLSEVPFVFILRGTQASRAEAIEEHILSALKEWCQTPPSKQLIEAALHQLEMDRLEITDDQGPYGLSLFSRTALLMQHGANPEDGLFIQELFSVLKEKLQDPKYLSHLVEDYFLSNPHRVLFVLKADTELEKKEHEEEILKLKNLKDQLTEKEQKEIIKKAKELELFQKSQEAQSLDILPTLEITDISPDVKNFPLKFYQSDQLSIFHHACTTNNFIYADLLFDLPDLPMKDFCRLKFLLSILTELGSGSRNYKENLELIQAISGGISAYSQMATHIKEQNQLKPLIGLRGKTLFENAESFFHLLKDTLIEPQINDPKRIKELVLQTYTYLRDKINRSSLGYCIKQSLAGYSTANQISNEMGGLPYFHYIEHLAKNIDEILQNLIQELIELKDKIFHLNNPQLILSAEKKTFDFLKKEAFFQFGKVPSHPFTPWLGLQNTTPVSSLAYEIASPVAFVSEGYKVYGIDHRLSPALTLASYIMENASLHPMIREQGGAYGCGATYQPMTGNFYFHSYRDPNILSTYLAFHEAIDHIMSKKLDPQLLHEAKFEFIQELDAPITPGYRAQTAYLYEKTGKTLEFRKDYKQRILDVTLDEIKNAVQEAFSNNHGNKVFASSRGLYEKEQNSLNQKGFDLKMMKIS